MLQVPNIMKKPVIWLPAIISSAILGPLSTMVFHMTNNASGAGMGTSGLVGQFMTWQTMAENEKRGCSRRTASLVFYMCTEITLQP